MKADSKAKADQLIADMMKRRDEFQANAKAHAEAGEAAWHAAKAQLDSEWDGFEAQVKTYFEGVGKYLEQQQATFGDVAAVQAKAWQDAAEKLHSQARQVAEAGRAEVEARIKQLRADAAEAEARTAEAQTGGNGILDGAERGVGTIARSLRSRQSTRVGRSQARCFVEFLTGLWLILSGSGRRV